MRSPENPSPQPAGPQRPLDALHVFSFVRLVLHGLAKAQLRGFGTIISFDVRGDAAAADGVCSRLRLIQHATSLGAVESTLERRAAIPGQLHLPPSLLRLSVGIEHVEDLWVDLDGALNAVA